jgi:hypothetical protein
LSNKKFNFTGRLMKSSPGSWFVKPSSSFSSYFSAPRLNAEAFYWLIIDYFLFTPGYEMVEH